jgi:serine/threonine protein kinase
MHKEKSAHRDVKPDNYIYSLNYNNIKLSDFGLSEFIESNE